jgi:hypothetical protein
MILQNPQWSPCDDFPSSVHHRPVPTQPTGPQAYARKELLWAFVEGFIVTWCGKLDLHNRQPSKVIRDMKHHTQHLLFQFVSKGNAHLLHSRNQKSPYQGFFWRSEVHVRSLRIRIVSHRVVCTHSVGLATSLLFWVFFFTDSRGSTVYIFLYVSFA